MDKGLGSCMFSNLLVLTFKVWSPAMTNGFVYGIEVTMVTTVEFKYIPF